MDTAPWHKLWPGELINTGIFTNFVTGYQVENKKYFRNTVEVIFFFSISDRPIPL